METNPKVVFKRKKEEIQLGIKNLIESDFEQDISQSEAISLELEIPKIIKLDKKLSSRRSISIWERLEKNSLPNKHAYLYLGLIIDYDRELNDKFLEFVKTCWKEFEQDYEALIDLIGNCNIINLIKLMTIFVFTLKVDKHKLNKEKIRRMIFSFKARFERLDFNCDFLTDLLIRRFLQFLQLKVGNFYKLDMHFWDLILNFIITRKTFKYIFLVLDSHLEFNKKTQKNQYKSLIYRILSQKDQMHFSIPDDFFIQHKYLVIFYIQFYLENALSGTNQNENNITSVINLFISYTKNKKKKNDIIEKSQLIRVFDFPEFSDSIYNCICEAVDLQLKIQSYNLAFLEKYFSQVKSIPNFYTVSKAEMITIQLMLFSRLKIDSSINNDILDYFENFFKHFYDYKIVNYDSDGRKAIDILLLIVQFLPSIWDRISQTINEINQKCVGLNRSLQRNRKYLWEIIKDKHDCQINANIPKPFLNFIDSLIEYLQKGTDESWNEMDYIVSNWTEGFNISSAEYKNNDYWAKVLMYFCLRSNHLPSLKEYWKKENEQKTKEIEKSSVDKASQKVLPTIDNFDAIDIPLFINKSIAQEEHKIDEEIIKGTIEKANYSITLKQINKDAAENFNPLASQKEIDKGANNSPIAQNQANKKAIESLNSQTNKNGLRIQSIFTFNFWRS